MYAKTAAGWAVEGRLANGVAGVVIDGDRVAIDGDRDVLVFDRAGGAWPLTATVRPHAVAAAAYFAGPLALRGNVLAVGDEMNQGAGAFSGAAYTFTKATSSSSPDCARSVPVPVRIPGTGTGCVASGSGAAKCPFMKPGTSTVAGMTPYGAIAFPFAWMDVIDGDEIVTTIELSNVAPRRQGTTPTLGVTMYASQPGYLQMGQTMKVSFSLALCSRTVTIDGTVTFDTITDAGRAPRVGGSISIEGNGWNVKGTFHADAACTSSSSH